MLTEEERTLLAELREKYGVIKAKRLANGALLVLRAPKREMDRAINRQAERGAQPFNIQRDLVLSCTVHPPSEQAQQLLRDLPSAVGVLADAVVELGGHQVEDVGED